MSISIPTANISVIKDFLYSYAPAGLSIWSGFAKGIRIATRGSYKYLPMTNGSLIPPTKTLTSYYMGSAILVGIIALIFIATIAIAIMQCCALCCCKKSLARKRNHRVWSRQSAWWSGIWFTFINLAFIISAIASFTGSVYLSTSVDSASSGTLGTIKSGQDIVAGLPVSINASFTSLKGIVNQTADSALHIIDFNSLQTTGVTPNMNALANGIQATQDNITAMLTQGDAISTTKVNTLSIAIQVNTTTTNDRADLAAWKANQQTFSGSGGATYVYSGTDLNQNAFDVASAAALGMTTGLQQSPDGSSTLSPLQNLGLNSYAAQIRDVVTNLPININTLMMNGTNTFKVSAIGALNVAQNSIGSSLAPFQGSAGNSLTNIYNQVSGIFTQVRTYNSYRHIVMAVLSAIILLILVVVNIGAVMKKPRVVKGCNFTAIGFYALIQLLALILYISAMLIGDACSLTFDYSPPPISIALDPFTQTSVNNVFILRDQCKQNQSLLTIATNLGYLNASSINMTKIASDQLESLDFSPIANSWNLSSSISINPSPTQKLSALTSLDTTGLNVTTLNNISTNALPALRNALTNLRDVYNVAITTSNGNSGLTFSPSSQAAAVVNAGYADFVSKLTTRRDALNAFLAVNGSIDQMQNSITSMISSVQSLNTSTHNAINNANTIPGYYNSSISSLGYFSGNATNNLTIAIPQIKNQTISSVGGVQNTLYASLTCQSLAENIFVIQDALCGRFMGGLDAVWFAYYVIGVFSFLSIPAFIYFANVMGASRRHSGSVDVEATYGASPKYKKGHSQRQPQIERFVHIN
ncbi:hypothetical protein QVD99_008140 [Batrachochytrium dendrobatidis]|nr:hypothetical protein O5D80_004707 [Batrachochytrium dendrobatidis]KAK5665306.1 hypothetical protein QVD99_008140 [Batrachochytrium dendrobatidis]